MYYELTDCFIVPSDASTTWDFFSKAENLPKITPPSMGFTVKTPAPVAIGQDAVIDYTIRWAGIPIRWRTRIIDWSPPNGFIDLQIRGPYTLWHHQHTFKSVDGGTECRDRVIYKLPGSFVGRIMHAATVKRQLMGIFQFRREVIGRELGGFTALQPDVAVRKLS